MSSYVLHCLVFLHMQQVVMQQVVMQQVIVQQIVAGSLPVSIFMSCVILHCKTQTVKGCLRPRVDNEIAR